MSRQIINAFSRSLSAASAALLIHIGSAAATTPQSDFQHQVSAVLAGTVAGDIASHSSLRANAPLDETAGSTADAQQFTRQLLLGWSVSHPARAASTTQSRNTAASAATQQSPEDVQIAVQRFLQGQKTVRSAS